MSTDRPVNGHPHPFTLEPLDMPEGFRPLSAAEVADIRAMQEADVSRRRNVAHRAAGNRGGVTVKQARDGAGYVRQQKGHSWVLHWCVLGIFSLFIVPIYYSVSPNHYWHL
jgi:hypothetical protein